MKSFTTKNNPLLYTCISFGVILLLWKIASLFLSPLVLPRLSTVAEAILQIFSSPKLLHMIGITVVRLVFGLVIGISIGWLIGLVMGTSIMMKQLFFPVIHLFQTVPPVSWVVLALVWFGFNGKPAVFIVVTSTIPLIAISVYQGLSHIDKKLLEMTKLYQFSKGKTLRYLILPSILPFFQSAFKVALGTGWKITVMGEVLTTGDGIGGMIKSARLNLEPEYIIAWSIIVVLLFYLSDSLMNLLSAKEKI